MKSYYAKGWEDTLVKHHLFNFSDIWAYKADWFEEPNARRGGWSGVSKVYLDSKSDTDRKAERIIFLKRQENHIYKSWRYPIRGMATFEREMRNILRFKNKNIPSLNPVYFACEKNSEHLRAILMTESLEHYDSLQALTERWIESGWPHAKFRYKIIEKLASTVRHMHKSGFRHGCLYPKHIFLLLNEAKESVDIKIIDLEKARKWPFPLNRSARDIGTLQRYSIGWSKTDRVRFLYAYCQGDKKFIRKIWEAVKKRRKRKDK